MNRDAARRIWLCADDYGMAPGISEAIRDLVARGRLNATSAMTVGPALDRAEAHQLSLLNGGASRVSIGLHVTLTAPFRPLTHDYAPARDGMFAPLDATLRMATLRRLRPDRLRAEIAAQVQRFIELFGRTPDFVDGHQHVQLFPQIRDAVFAVASELAPGAWLRQCGRVSPLRSGLHDRKALLLDVLSVRFRSRARRLGLRTNPAFAGTYAFREEADFAALFPAFLKGMTEGGLIMCHPGFVDAELVRLDPLTDLREREYEFLKSEAFPAMLEAHGITLW